MVIERRKHAYVICYIMLIHSRVYISVVTLLFLYHVWPYIYRSKHSYFFSSIYHFAKATNINVISGGYTQWSKKKKHIIVKWTKIMLGHINIMKTKWHIRQVSDNIVKKFIQSLEHFIDCFLSINKNGNSCTKNAGTTAVLPWNRYSLELTVLAKRAAKRWVVRNSLKLWRSCWILLLKWG